MLEALELMLAELVETWRAIGVIRPALVAMLIMFYAILAVFASC